MLDRVHFGLLLYRTTDEWYIIPENDVVNEIVVVDCNRQVLRKQSVNSPIPKNAQVSTIQVFLGTIKLLNGYYVVISNDCQPSIELLDHRVFEITKVQFLRVNPVMLPKNNANRLVEERFVQMMRDSCSKQQFFCSRTYDLSRSCQENFAKSKTERSIRTTDSEFVWNWHLMKDVLSSCPGLEQYLMPIINGYCSEYKRDIHYVLISRRSRCRAGIRYYRRGVEPSGNVANFVETEQIVCNEGTLYSHVQIRGSIPVFWVQKPNLMYKPAISIDNKIHDTAFDRHFHKLTSKYGDVTIISLIDHSGLESGLNRLYRKLAEQLPHLIYREFDFHHHSSQSDDYVYLLMDMLKESLHAGSFCVVDIAKQRIESRQKGVVRTNCIDSLDRTNVVQSLVAKVILEKQLLLIHPNAARHFSQYDNAHSVVRRDGSISLVDFDAYLFQNFQNIWANNADALSLQYSGTPAMKTDYTRTGKRTFEGRCNDAYYSALRYILNNFSDGYKQDAIDLFVGNYVVGSEPLEKTLARTARKPDYRLLVLPLLSVISMFMLLLTLSRNTESPRQHLINVLFWVSALGSSLCCTLLCGENIVDAPHLLPLDGPVTDQQ